jgi:cupin fold WbuC family metalloprotein
MKTIKFNDEVLYAAESIAQIDAIDIKDLKEKAGRNPRKRIRICMHKDIEDDIHEMFIVHEKSCYVRPHKHFNKIESFHIIEGKADIILFHENGEINRVISMGDLASGLKFFYRLPPSCYHTLLIKSDVLVFHEITNGPFSPDKTALALWSPKETDIDAVSQYMAMLASFTKNHK